MKWIIQLHIMKADYYGMLSGVLYFTCQDPRLFLKRLKRENQCFDHYSQSRGIIIEDCRVFYSDSPKDTICKTVWMFFLIALKHTSKKSLCF